MNLLLLTLSLAIHSSLATAYNLIDISGDGWTLTSPGNSSINNVPARVPSENYMDLYAAGIVADPIYGYQEEEQAWVRYSNWTYTSPILSQLNRTQGLTTQIVFEGLDTYTAISFCNQLVATTDDQYQQWIVDITDVLANCSMNDTQLAINFGPAQNITHAIGMTATGQSASNVNFADGCNNKTGDEFSCKAWARKEQSDFGWDWSPNLIPAGPWRNISILQMDQESIYINNAAIDIIRQGQMNNLPPDQSQPWVFNASLDFLGTLPQGSSLQLDLTDSNGNQIYSGALGNITSNNMTITGWTIIDPSMVQLWWPHDMGSQPLYNATISIMGGGNNSTITSVWRRVGFRTIILNLQPISDADLAKGVQPGSNWHFEINGQTFYAKGSNLVPLSVFWPSVNTTMVSHLFELALDAHFNMFRVWSSGVYLDDSIYGLADEMGILLWSEFEFTDAEYDASPEYEAVYQAEAYYNVRRVNYHPSLALWAGGNELESIQLDYFFNATNPTSIMLDYQQTFERELIKCVYANSKSISYIPSSTYNGYLSLNFSSDRPQLPRYENTSGPNYLYSDTDYYGSGDQAFNISSYPIGRFADEFGFISMPGIESWDDTGPNITSFDDPIVVYHNRHSGANFGQVLPGDQDSLLGIAQMTSAVVMYYPAPAISDARANFTAWIWSSEVFQADNYAFQIAFYRRGSGRPEHQLGCLYWQFNDVWVAPTWSSIPTNLKPKITQYMVKDIYSPVIIRPYPNIDNDTMEVWVTSDQFDTVNGMVTYEWMTWGGEPVDVGLGSSNSSISVQVQPVNSTMVLSYNNVLSTISSKVNVSDVVMRLSVTASGNGTSFNHTSWYHPVYLSNATLQDPQLTLNQTGNNSFIVTAPSAIAAWVSLDYSAHQVQGYWSENGFWLQKGESKTVTLNVWNDWTGNSSWVDGVTVRSMWDNVVSREYAASI